MNQGTRSLPIFWSAHSRQYNCIRRVDPAIGEVCSLKRGENISADVGDPTERDRLEKLMVILLAGPAAECRYTAASPWAAGGTDLDNAVEVACRRYAWGTQARMSKRIEELWDRTKSLIYDPENWDCVQRVAEVLKAFKKLDFNVCGRLIREQQKLHRANGTEVTLIMDNAEYSRVVTEFGTRLLWDT